MECQRFKDRVCVVTGSTAGIGYAIAVRFALEGAKVVVSSRKRAAVDAAVGKIVSAGKGAINPANVLGVVCHVDNAADRLLLLNRTKAVFGEIDVLVFNTAASTHYGPTLATDERSFDKMMATNVKSAFFHVQEALPFLRRSSFDRAGVFSTNILFISSIAAYNPSSPIGIYGVTKTALLGIARTLALDLGKKGIRVNTIAPGIIRTDFADALVRAIDAGRSPMMPLMRRAGEAEEVAAAAAYLCSGDASYVTGETHVVGGGPARL